MPSESISAGARAVRILHRDDDDGNVGAGGTVTSGKQRLDGLTRLEGLLYSAQAPAAGYPRVCFSADGVNWNVIRSLELQRDPTQSGYAYRIDQAVEAPYAKVEWIHGTTDSTMRGFVKAVAGTSGAGGGSGTSAGVSALGGTQVLTSDKDADLTAAIAAGEHGTLNLTGLPSSKGTVKRVVLMAVENLDWEVHFFTTDGFKDADSDADSWLAKVDLLALDAVQIGGGDGATVYRYVAELSLPYVDEDNSSELHVSLRPTSGAKTAGAGGQVTLRFVFTPEV